MLDILVKEGYTSHTLYLEACLFNELDFIQCSAAFSHSVVSNSGTPWTVALQTPLSMGLILQARILDWVAMPFSRGSSQPRDRTQVSHISDGFFTV